MKQTGISRFFSAVPKAAEGGASKAKPRADPLAERPGTSSNGIRKPSLQSKGGLKRPRDARGAQGERREADVDLTDDGAEQKKPSGTQQPTPSSASAAAAAAVAAASSTASAATAAEPVAKRPCSEPSIAPRDTNRYAILQRKLVGGPGGSAGRPPAGSGGGGDGSASGAAAKHPVGPQPGAKLTPLEQQVVELKRKHPGVLLMIEVGYKMRFFGEDAETASRVCNILCYPDHSFLSASVPVQRTHVHIRRLVRAGYKVGIVRQTESAALKAAGSNKSGPFVRSLAALHTPATLDAGDVENGGLDSTDKAAASADQDDARGSSNCLLAVVEQEGPGPGSTLALVAVDCMSGTVRTAQIHEGGSTRSELEAALLLVAPVELLLVEPLSAPTEKLLGAWAGSAAGGAGTSVERTKRSKDSAARAEAVAFFNKMPEEVLKLEDLVVEGLSHVLAYLRAFFMEKVLAQAACFQPLRDAGNMQLSPNCLVQLEVLQNSDTGEEHGSLLWLLSSTATRGGRRLMRQWTSHPLTDAAAIAARQDAVAELCETVGSGDVDESGGGAALERLPSVLTRLPDLEVGVTRMLHHSASPSEAYRVLCAFGGLPAQLGLPPPDQRHKQQQDEAAGVGEQGNQGIRSPLLRELVAHATDPDVEEAAAAMLRGLSKDAAEQDDQINLFADTSDYPEVFECHEEVKGAEDHLIALLGDIRKTLRRPTLNYTEIQNQGKYLVEVPVDSVVPSDWVKVCGTKKVDRYWPPAVKEGIFKREQAIERRRAVCKAAWGKFLDKFASHYCAFRGAAVAVSNADALLGLAKVSSRPGFCRPEFVDVGSSGTDGAAVEPQIRIVGGRHPVLDVLLASGCVPNDTELLGGPGGRGAMLVTGPNMGGKSCFIKQTALIVIMAQMGCYVPAESCKLHVVDCIHTRMGASDDLASSRSTFEVELTETSEILAKATSKSLVIIDELGRGTSTHDGVAIASATLEHLLVARHCLVLFVTHYPQLGELLARLPSRAAALYMDYQRTEEHGYQGVAEEGGAAPAPAASAPRITFLYKLVPGIVESSFGMNVASMAGIPATVTARASEVAATLKAKVEAPQPKAIQCGAAETTEASAGASSSSLLTRVRQCLGSGDLDALVALHEKAHQGMEP